MAYIVSMFYKDEKSMNIKILDEEIEKFFTDLNQSQVYIHPRTEQGFWTNIADIRYILTNKEGESDVQCVKEDHDSVAKIPGNADGAEEGEEAAEGS